MAAYKKISVGLGLGLVFAAIILFVFRYSETGTKTNQPADKPDATISEAAPSLQSADDSPLEAMPYATSANAELKAQLLQEYKCQKAACDLSPFLAENEDEALWLRARGYPSPQQREEAKRLPTVELKLRAEKGDLIAASLYGERLMEESDWSKAYGVLLDAAAEGSLYSLYALSYRAANHPQHRSRIEAGKWLRLAYLAGDYKATIQLVQIYPPVNEMPEQLLIDRYAAHSYRKFLRYRSYPRPASEE